jgi:hypothetical protein
MTITTVPVLSATLKAGEYHCDLCPFHTAVLKLLDYHMGKHSEPGRWTGK